MGELMKKVLGTADLQWLLDTLQELNEKISGNWEKPKDEKFFISINCFMDSELDVPNLSIKASAPADEIYATLLFLVHKIVEESDLDMERIIHGLNVSAK